ncbi:MAG: LPP20 family lipoprotein [Gammaproteobacteria bacterium]|jgi:outer membrane protein FlgP|nr:LPP20 family lipoprotein [Gammaproteobacteria bacterium]MBU2180257.1 LPP20 family lipoprotein [Gammaproteobacteria bacterium]MBU2224565.1 LPP20 family lipoprotein [Gammaproteobacteria bacterium]MBU2280276.1 LPP20 family lipoprotein [Gammaproteobacteria bacterium]MBU2427539.1 LPP20 family lipoprotein [Gammaproteobacteria bacterium]
MNKLIVMMLSSVLLSGCSMLMDKEVQWESVPPEHFPVLKAVGYAPVSAQQATTDEQKMLMAMKASKLEAYKELAEQVYGQKIDYKVTMAQAAMGNEQLKASLQGVIRGARVVKTYPVGQFYATEMELDFKQVYDLYQNAQPVRRVKAVKYY